MTFCSSDMVDRIDDWKVNEDICDLSDFFFFFF